MRSTIARACSWKSVLRCGSSGAARFSSRRLGRSPSEGDAYAQAPDSEKDWIGGLFMFPGFQSGRIHVAEYLLAVRSLEPKIAASEHP